MTHAARTVRACRWSSKMLIKTEKCRDKLRPGNRTLGQRERALLLVANGQQSESKVAELFQGEGRRLLDQLLTQGYLQRQLPTRNAGPGIAPPAAAPQAAPGAHGEQFTGPGRWPPRACSCST